MQFAHLVDVVCLHSVHNLQGDVETDWDEVVVQDEECEPEQDVCACSFLHTVLPE